MAYIKWITRYNVGLLFTIKLLFCVYFSERFELVHEKAINARVHCTFGGNVEKMYKKVKKYFEGDLCHAIVFGTPVIIHENKIVMPKDKLSRRLKITKF